MIRKLDLEQRLMQLRLEWTGQNTISASRCCWRSSAVLSSLSCGLISSACSFEAHATHVLRSPFKGVH